jgi:TolA-binding protein
MNRTALTVILIILLLFSIGGNTFLYMEKLGADEELKEKLALQLSKDSLNKELNRMEDSLNMVIQTFQDENKTLILKVEELESDKNPKIQAAYAQIYALRRQLADGGSSSSSSSTTADYAGPSKSGSSKSSKSTGSGNMKVEDLRKQLEEAKRKIAELMAQIEVLTKEKDDYLAQLNNEKSAKAILEAENIDLKDRLDRGARPQFGALLINGLMDKKGMLMLTDKAKTVAKLQINFDVLENPLVTQPIEEEVIIRIIDPNGNVVTTNAKLTDKSKLASMNNTITFDGGLQKVKWTYPEKGVLTGKLLKGKYVAELWTRGLMRQKNNFTLE